MITNISRYRLSILIPLFFLILLPSYSLEEFEHRVVKDILYAEELVNYGVQAGRLGEYDFAEVAFEEAIKLNPNYDVAHYGLGLALISLNNRAAALTEYEILRSLNHGLATQLYYIIYTSRKIELLWG